MSSINKIFSFNRPNSLGASVPKWFISVAAVILIMTGLAKEWSAFGSAKVLALDEPITGIRFGYLMLAAGVVELFVAGACLLGKSQRLSLALIAWLATCFFVYRIGLWWIGWSRPCSCLGSFTDALHIPPQTADTAMKIVLAYLLIGSYGTLFWLWRQRRKQSGASAIGAESL